MHSTATDGRFLPLLERNAVALNEAAAQPLLQQMASGTISASSYSTYLAIEGRFVHTAARAMGYCAWTSPDWTSLSGYTAMLANLVADQVDHFDSTAAPEFAVPEGADALAEVIGEAIASDGYPAVATCLCAAETLYLKWCSEAVAARPPQAGGPAWDWIELHTQPAFVSGVRFLQDTVDRLSPTFTDAALDHWFQRMLTAENSFHAAATERNAP